MKSQISWIVITVFCAFIFCASFVYIYTKQQAKKFVPIAEVEKKIETPLPKTKLFVSDSDIFSDEELRKGNVVLMFLSPTCEACKVEGEFLKEMVGKRGDVRFYGIAPAESSKVALESVQREFPFKVLFDQQLSLTFGLGIRSVPTKIYLKDGIIKKIWRGASIDEAKQKEFINWLEGV